MGLRIMYDPIDNYAAMYDSVTMTAFGPVFMSDKRHGTAEDTAKAFVQWATEQHGSDLRNAMPGALHSLYSDFTDQTDDQS